MGRGLGVLTVATALAVAAGAATRDSVMNGRIAYLRPLGGYEPPYHPRAPLEQGEWR